MKARQLIEGANFDPKQLQIITQAFDDAWGRIAPVVSKHEGAIEAAQLELATTILSLARNGIPEADVLAFAALEVMAQPTTRMTKQSSRIHQLSYKKRTKQLMSQREKLLAEIDVRATLGAITPMLIKARTLLTRFWAEADWKERAELVPTARWMLQMDSLTPPRKRSRS